MSAAAGRRRSRDETRRGVIFRRLAVKATWCPNQGHFRYGDFAGEK